MQEDGESGSSILLLSGGGGDFITITDYFPENFIFESLFGVEMRVASATHATFSSGSAYSSIEPPYP